MAKNNISSFQVLDKLYDQERQFKKELAKTFLEYIDSLSPTKRIEQMELLLYDTQHKNLSTLGRRLTLQEERCLYLASKGKEVKETARILGLSQRTIKFHRANITKKLDVPNLMAAVALKNKACATDNNEFTHTIVTQTYWKNLGAKLPGHVYWKDTAGLCRGANNLQAMFLGCKSEKDLIGKTDFDFFVKEHGEAIRKNDLQVMETQKEYCIEEIVNNQEGKQAIFLSRKIPLYDTENKKIIGIVGTSLDITTKKKDEIAKLDFIMQMAHDLKSSLDLITVKIQEKGSPNQKNISQLVNEASGKLLELISLMTS